MSKTAEIIRCAGSCGRSTTDPDLWDPCVVTGESYCDACWPHRKLGSIEFRVTAKADGYEVHTRTEDSHGWSLFDRFDTIEAIGEAVAEEVSYQREVASR